MVKSLLLWSSFPEKSGGAGGSGQTASPDGPLGWAGVTSAMVGERCASLAQPAVTNFRAQQMRGRIPSSSRHFRTRHHPSLLDQTALQQMQIPISHHAPVGRTQRLAAAPQRQRCAHSVVASNAGLEGENV